MNSYYYLDAANQQQGPLDGNLLPSKGVTAQTLVWANGMAEWTPDPVLEVELAQAAGQVAELQPLFVAQPAPQPAPQPAYQQPAQPAYQQPQPAYQQPQPQPAYQQPAAGAPAKPDNYLVWAILSTICCCLVTGIISIVYSTKVDGLYAAGQYAEAQAAAKSAKNWALGGAIAAAVIWLLYIIIYGIYFHEHFYDAFLMDYRPISTDYAVIFKLFDTLHNGYP